MTDKRIFRHTITREIKAYAIWSSYWSTFPLKKKSRNQEITKSRNQKIRKSRSIQFYTHWSIPIFPSHLDPFKTSTTGNRIAKGRTLSTARSTTSSPLLADFAPPLSSISHQSRHRSVPANTTWTTTPTPATWLSRRLNQEPAEEAANDNPNIGEFEFGSDESERVSILLSTYLQSQPNSTHSPIMHAWTTSEGATRIFGHGRRPESPKRWWK